MFHSQSLLKDRENDALKKELVIKTMRIFKSNDEYRGEGRRVVAEINNSG